MKNGDKKAHPFINKNGDDEHGLTKREYFAAMAMQGLLANNDSWSCDTASCVAEFSVRLADELLKQLEDEKP
ncbi:MAG: hypothetical protein ACKO96_18700 [Flammeovirgaceae bacterium]